MKTIVIIHNLNSRGKYLNEAYIKELLNKKGIKFHYFQTTQISEIDEIIDKYNNPSDFQYCSIGGDGSLNALINSLMKNNITLPEVSCLPGGSGSDFIRTFALPQNIEDAVEHLNNENFYEVDVGVVKNDTNVKYFINVLNIGFLASTVEVSENFPNIFRAFRYPLSFWIKIITARAKDMSISNEKYEFVGKAFNICVCNAQYFGGGWNISPKSSLQDGLFNIQVFAVTKIKAMQIFFLAKKGLHLKESAVKLKRLSKLTVNSKDPIEIDGDFFGYGPANIFIKKRAIRFKI